MTAKLLGDAHALEKKQADWRMERNRAQALAFAVAQLKDSKGYSSVRALALDTLVLAEHFLIYIETGEKPKVKP